MPTAEKNIGGGYIAAKGLISRDITLKVLFKCNLKVENTHYKIKCKF